MAHLPQDKVYQAFLNKVQSSRLADRTIDLFDDLTHQLGASERLESLVLADFARVERLDGRVSVVPRSLNLLARRLEFSEARKVWICHLVGRESDDGAKPVERSGKLICELAGCVEDGPVEVHAVAED